MSPAKLERPNLLYVVQAEFFQEPSAKGDIPLLNLDPVGQLLPGGLPHLGGCVGDADCVARLDTAGSWARLGGGLVCLFCGGVRWLVCNGWVLWGIFVLV